jgi:hypothetical protein
MTAHPGKIDIDQQEIGAGPLCYLHCPVPACCLTNYAKTASSLDCKPQASTKQRLMIDEQHTPGEHPFSMPPPSIVDPRRSRVHILSEHRVCCEART